MEKNKLGQVWVETVIYTLIGLAIIGLLLAFAKPKIDEMRDRLVVEQTIESMNEIDGKIQEVYNKGPGNKRVPDLKISRGKLIIDAESDKISWVIDSRYKYSEPNEDVPLGNLNVITTAGDPWKVELSKQYNFDLTYDGEQERKEVDSATVSYKFKVENMGFENGEVVVDVVVS